MLEHQCQNYHPSINKDIIDMTAENQQINQYYISAEEDIEIMI